MSDFVSSNGITVAFDGQGSVRAGLSEAPERGTQMIANDVYAKALREFFQKERDDELGRWRDPQFPEFVAYWHPVLSKLTVIWEPQGGSTEFKRDDVPPPGSGGLPAAVARAFFDAHPEPKPWHDAKPGEVWIVRWEGSTSPEEAVIVPSDGWNRNWAVEHARRIWPEVTS